MIVHQVELYAGFLGHLRELNFNFILWGGMV